MDDARVMHGGDGRDAGDAGEANHACHAANHASYADDENHGAYAADGEVSVEHSEVRFGGRTIGYRIRRSPRRATVSIAVDPTEGVLVTAPTPAPVHRLDDIVHAKAPWILERLKRQSDVPPSPKELVSGETFLYLGRQLRLRVDAHGEPRAHDSGLRDPAVVMEGGWLRVPVPRHLKEEHRPSYVRAALIDWYKDHARARLAERTALWAARMGISPPALLLAEPRKRWGSASPSGVVRLNWRIIQTAVSLVDYVVAHELTHLAHPNHTGDFWAALGKSMPDYEGRKARLRALGPQLEW